MKNNLDDPAHQTSELKRWLVENGRDTVKKYLEFEKGGFKKPLTFQGCSSLAQNKQFEAFIDPENKFGVKEKFSQVFLRYKSSFVLLKTQIFFCLYLDKHTGAA